MANDKPISDEFVSGPYGHTAVGPVVSLAALRNRNDTPYTISKDEIAISENSELGHPFMPVGLVQETPRAFLNRNTRVPGVERIPSANASFRQLRTLPWGSHQSLQMTEDDQQATQLHRLQWLIQRNKQLESEIDQLREGSLGISQPASLSNNIQVFHCLHDEGPDESTIGDDSDDDGWSTYSSRPSWEIQEGDATLRSQFLVPDSREYIKKKGGIDFVIYKFYTKVHQQSAVKAALRDSEPLPEPESAYQHILLNSDDMVDAVQTLFASYPTLRMEFPKVHRDQQLESPFIWWYHCRKLHAGRNPRSVESPLVAKLTDWIEINYAATYNAVDDQFRRGRVSGSSMEYFMRSGQVIVSDDNGLVRGYQAISRPTLAEDTLHDRDEISAAKRQQRWNVRAQRLDYSGEFRCTSIQLPVKLETDTKDEEVDIASLAVLPLEHVSHDVRERLLRRGKMFWKCRDRQLVSYEGKSVAGGHGVWYTFCFDSHSIIMLFI